MNIIRTKRKTLAIEITRDARVLVRAPYRMKNADIQKFVEEKREWIEKNLRLMKEKQLNQPIEPLTMEEIKQLAEKAMVKIPQRVDYYAAIVGVTYGKITIRNQKTRWGSCSRKGNLNFNCLLMLAPEAVLDYVVVHELCHRKEMNHSKRFWNEVERVLPSYKKQESWLKENGESIMRRNPKKNVTVQNPSFGFFQNIHNI
ncbi:MAG: M48 family metallopeptidase [Clostridiales bacterium]|nr:M48 family metallopeptidase [Clostridiales bacterium]